MHSSQFSFADMIISGNSSVYLRHTGDIGNFFPSIFILLLPQAVSSIHENSRQRGVSATGVRQRASKDTANNLNLAMVYYLYFSFYFLLFWLSQGEKPTVSGFSLGNGIATGGATGCHFQNGSSICSVTSQNRPLFFQTGCRSPPRFSRSLPLLSAIFRKTFLVWEVPQRSMHWFIISLISRISHCFGSSKAWFKASL